MTGTAHASQPQRGREECSRLARSGRRATTQFVQTGAEGGVGGVGQGSSGRGGSGAWTPTKSQFEILRMLVVVLAQ